MLSTTEHYCNYQQEWCFSYYSSVIQVIIFSRIHIRTNARFIPDRAIASLMKMTQYFNKRGHIYHHGLLSKIYKLYKLLPFWKKRPNFKKSWHELCKCSPEERASRSCCAPCICDKRTPCGKVHFQPHEVKIVKM